MVPNDESSELRRRVDILDQLSAIREKSDLQRRDQVLAWLADTDDAVRSEAARTLGYLGDSGDELTVNRLLACLDDTSEFVRTEAIESLAQLKVSSVAPRLRKLAAGDAADLVRASAIEALAILDPEDSLDVFRTGLSDEVEVVRVCAARALSRTIAVEAIPVLLEAHETELSDLVRVNISLTLNELGYAPALTMMFETLKSLEISALMSVLNQLGDAIEDNSKSRLVEQGAQMMTELHTIAERLENLAAASRQLAGKFESILGAR